VTDLFNALSNSLGRFVYAWLVPSLVTTAIFWFVLLPDIGTVRGANGEALSGPSALVVFTLAAFALSVLFAYTALHIYRFLEGYTIPRRLANRLRRRHIREWHRLHYMWDLDLAPHSKRGRLEERLNAYPDDVQSVLPTRLGNAMRAMELYGVTRFGLDSQSLWYELQSVAPGNLRQDQGDARATVDFFVSSVAHLCLLAAVSATTAVATGSLAALIVAIVASVLVPAAYQNAVRNVGEWRWTVQALINVGRVRLPAELGLQMPRTFADEKRMWWAWTSLVTYGPRDAYLRVLDLVRSRETDGARNSRSTSTDPALPSRR
jgi:hypothetical protein